MTIWHIALTRRKSKPCGADGVEVRCNYKSRISIGCSGLGATLLDSLPSYGEAGGNGGNGDEADT